MKKNNKIFLYIGISIVLIAILLLVVPFLIEGSCVETRFWALYWAVIGIPILVCAEAVVLFIHNIIASQKLLSIRIFRWVQGMMAIFELLWWTMFFLGMSLTDWNPIAMYIIGGIIISLWISEISVRLVIRHRNKKAIQKAE